jgi:hypothetical protein
VAVQAGLVAAVAEIGLEDFQAPAPDRGKIRFGQQGKGVAHEGILPGTSRRIVAARADFLHNVVENPAAAGFVICQ